MGGINIHIYPSPIVHESRMLKETAALAQSELFDEVHLVGVREGALPAEQPLDKIRKIVRLSDNGSSRGRLAQIRGRVRFMWSVVRHYRKCRVSVISCHCLALLPLSFVLRILTGAQIVYEAHELETERHGWSRSVRLAAKLIESILIKSVSWVVVVGPSIERWYRERYQLQNISTVRNIPASRQAGGKSELLRKTLGIPDTSLIFIYQGLLMSGRAIELLLRVFAKVSHHHLVFLGFGGLEDKIRQSSLVCGNIHYLQALPPGEAEPYTSSADVGIALFENTSLSYYYSCPNKLFEYIMAGIPVVVSDFPDMAAVVDELDCGWKIPVCEVALEQLVTSLTRDEVEAAARRAATNGQVLSWEKEAAELVRAYRAVLQANQQGAYSAQAA